MTIAIGLLAAVLIVGAVVAFAVAGRALDILDGDD